MTIKKVLIIGGVGYIGSALYQKLTRDVALRDMRKIDKFSVQINMSCPYKVDTVDLEWFGNYVNPNNFVLDYKYLTREQLAKYDVVVLLAGHSSVPMSTGDASSTFRNNLANFVDLLGKLTKGQKFIYAGSASVYNGIPDEATEDYDLLKAANIYDMTKQDLDKYVTLFPDVEFYGLRFGTVNGVSPNLRTDIMINAMAETAMQGKAVKVFNEGIHRPILYLQDLVNAIKAIIDCPDDHRGVYNLASFNSTSGAIAEGVADSLHVDLQRIRQTDYEKSVNTKLVTPYDFAVNSQKFEETFNFQFTGTVDKIAEEVANHFDEVNKGKRVQPKLYV